MSITARTQYILLTSLVLVALAGLIIGLTVGLRTPAPENGGSPVGPPAYNLSGPEPSPAPAPQPTNAPPPWGDSETRSFRSTAVVTDTNVCSTIGSDILSAGGSVVDAIIAAGACVGVINHHSAGIGGGHFITGYEKPRGSSQREMFSILAREWAPLAANENMFQNDSNAARKGGLAIATPGEIRGFYAAWERYGVLPWADLFSPAIDLCNGGFTVERSLSGAIRQYEDDIRADPNLSELFVKSGGALVTEGDILVNSKLGDTLTKIAGDPHTFYNGSLADDIVADIQEYGGIITKEDLLAYQAKYKEPLSVPLSNGGYTVYGPRPPSSGVVLHFILNVLNGFQFKPEDLSTTNDQILTYHRVVEAFKFAYAKRSELGDEDFVELTELLANLTSVDYAEGIRAKINDSSTQGWKYYDPAFDIIDNAGTAHMSAQTRDGSAVALTATINLFFGSNVRGSRTGIMFNDEMDDFSIPGTSNSFGVPASPSNYIQPGKMPMSSMCPVLILDSDSNIVFNSGASGGTRITTATSLVAMHALWFNMTLHDSTDTPRVHHQLIPEDIKYEPHISQELLDGFASKNHALDLYGSIAVVGSIHNTCPGAGVSDTCLHATSDGRKGGTPDGT